MSMTQTAERWCQQSGAFVSSELKKEHLVSRQFEDHAVFKSSLCFLDGKGSNSDGPWVLDAAWYNLKFGKCHLSTVSADMGIFKLAAQQ